ncbi:hypothetical protein TNCV_4973031 [Trichonephila clavipes]|nr:hypothetical protein TNCV_4973031 [Trichonephila clavipes]
MTSELPPPASPDFLTTPTRGHLILDIFNKHRSPHLKSRSSAEKGSTHLSTIGSISQLPSIVTRQDQYKSFSNSSWRGKVLWVISDHLTMLENYTIHGHQWRTETFFKGGGNLILPRASKPNGHSRDLFHAIQSYDMAAVDFLHHENSLTWAGVEPATVGTGDLQQTNYATQPAIS